MKTQSKIVFALTCTALLGACGDIATQQQAGDGIAPPSAAEMDRMAHTAYVYHLRNEPSKLRVNSLQVSDALALFPGDKSDFVVCVQWEAEHLGDVYSTERFTGRLSGRVAREGDTYTAYGAFVARFEDNSAWQAVLFESGNGKIGTTPISEICGS